jgi:hypothetical protein
MHLIFFLHAGSTYTGGTLNSSSFASAVNNQRAAGISSFYDSTDRTFFITGVQLEVGQNPTEFEHEPFGVTFEKCRRYYYEQDTTNHYLRTSGTASTGDYYTDYVLPTPMRTAPTWTAVAGSDLNGHNSVTINTKTPHIGYVDFNKTGTNSGSYYSFNKVTASAEL